jgi:hypothetical protein
MHYCGIVDAGDSEWYDKVLKACSSLDVNDFLHDVSPYVTNRPLPPYRVATTSGSQGAPSTSAPPVRLVESEIFHDSHEKRRPQYPNVSGDEPYMGTCFGQGGGGFNQFGSMERALSGSDFLSNPDPSAFHGTEPVSSNRGYESQQRGDAAAPRSSNVANRSRLQRSKQGGRSALRAPGGHVHPATVASSATVGGGNTGPTNELSPDSWSGHSFPHETGDVNASAPSQREPHINDRPQPERSAMVMDDAAPGMDLQSDAEAPGRPSSDVASAIAAAAPFAVTAAGLGAVNDIEPRLRDGEIEGDDTSEGSKKKKEPLFVGGVELVDLDNCDVPDMRLQYESEDTDDDEAPNREDMDVDVGPPSYAQTVRPSSSTASAQVSPAIPVQTDPLVESSGGFPDPLFNAAGKGPHPDAVIVKQEAGWFQLKEAKRLKKTAEKLAEQRERERLAKENEEQRRKNELLEQLIKEKLRGNIEALLSGKLDGPSPSTPTPILQGIQSMAMPAAVENFLPQESPPNPDEFIAGHDIPIVQSYPRVKDNSLVPPLKSISPMATDPPTLSPFAPSIQHSSLVG